MRLNKLMEEAIMTVIKLMEAIKNHKIVMKEDQQIRKAKDKCLVEILKKMNEAKK